MNTNEYLVKFVRKKQYRIYTYFQRWKSSIIHTEIIDAINDMDVHWLDEAIIDKNLLSSILKNDYKVTLESKDKNGNTTKNLYKITDIIFSPPSNIIAFVEEIEDIGDRFIDNKYLQLSANTLSKICFRDKIYQKLTPWNTKIYDYGDEILQKIPEWDKKNKIRIL